MIKVSIIIPVHNAVLYLDKCVKSCISQTLDDIEIILVDDASTDNSRDLIEKYAKENKKIKTLFLEKNMKQGAARNKGIKIAQGQYLLFVDSDDYIDCDMCRDMYLIAEQNDFPDMIASNYFVESENNTRVADLKCDCELGTLTKESKREYLREYGMFWARLYRKNFIVDNKIYFPEGIFFEDGYFNYISIIYAKTICKTKNAYYHYYQSDNSTLRAKNNIRLYDRINIEQMILDNAKKLGIYNGYEDCFEKKYIEAMASCIYNICLRHFDCPDVSTLEKIKKLTKASYPYFRKSSVYKKMPFELRYYYRLNSISPKLAVFSYKHKLENKAIYIEALKNKISGKKHK